MKLLPFLVAPALAAGAYLSFDNPGDALPSQGTPQPFEEGRSLLPSGGGACAPGAPIDVDVQIPGGEADFLLDNYLGTFEVFVQATSLAPVSVEVVLSDGLYLNQGSLTFTDDGEGAVLVLDRREEAPQTISILASVDNDEVGTFATLDSWGAPLDSQLDDGVLQDLVDGDEEQFVLLPSTTEGGE